MLFHDDRTAIDDVNTLLDVVNLLATDGIYLHVVTMLSLDGGNAIAFNNGNVNPLRHIANGNQQLVLAKLEVAGSHLDDIIGLAVGFKLLDGDVSKTATVQISTNLYILSINLARVLDSHRNIDGQITLISRHVSNSQLEGRLQRSDGVRLRE